MYGIRYTEQADADLFDIYAYETWGQAIAYTNGLRYAINKIATEPYIPFTMDRSRLGVAR
jgi:plasmid stabilization system protein ParE